MLIKIIFTATIPHTPCTAIAINLIMVNIKKLAVTAAATMAVRRVGSVVILVQNLQKKPGLASSVVHMYRPNVALVQEINDSSEEPIFAAKSVSKRGYGTAIYAKEGVENVKTVLSPHAETGGLIYKKTTIATSGSIQYVSFHGYNGQPFKKVQNLTDHVEAVKRALETYGFRLAVSWPYPGRNFPLDHAFVRGVKLEASSIYDSEADHQGAILQLSLSGSGCQQID